MKWCGEEVQFHPQSTRQSVPLKVSWIITTSANQGQRLMMTVSSLVWNIMDTITTQFTENVRCIWIQFNNLTTTLWLDWKLSWLENKAVGDNMKISTERGRMTIRSQMGGSYKRRGKRKNDRWWEMTETHDISPHKIGFEGTCHFEPIKLHWFNQFI